MLENIVVNYALKRYQNEAQKVCMCVIVPTIIALITYRLHLPSELRRDFHCDIDVFKKSIGHKANARLPVVMFVLGQFSPF